MIERRTSLFVIFFVVLLMELSFLHGPLWAQQHEYEKFIEQPSKGSPWYQRAMAQFIKDLNGHVKVQEKWDPILQNPQRGVFTLEQIAGRYTYIKEREDNALRDYKESTWALQQVFSRASSASKGAGIQGVLLAEATAATGKLVGSGLELLQAEGHQRSEQFLAEALANVRKLNANGFAGLQQATSATDVIKIIQDNSPVTNQALDKLQGNAKAITQGFYTQILNDRLQQGFHAIAELANSVQGNETQIAEQAEKLSAVSNTLEEFRKNTVDEVRKIQDTQQEINQALSSLNNEVQQNINSTATNTRDIAFMQNFLFGKMTPSEQLTALQNGFYEKMGSKEKERLTLKITLQVKRQEITETISKYTNGAGELANIAAKLPGLDPKIGNALREAQTVGNSVSSIMNAAASGNYLAMAGTVANLLFGGKGEVDVAEQRHQQVMDSLHRIEGGIAEIQNMISILGQNQQRIMETQIEIMKSLANISEQIERNQRQIMDKFYGVENLLLTQQDTMNAVLEGGFRRCQIFLDRRASYGYANGAFPNFDSMRTHFKWTADDYGTPCLYSLADFLGSPFASGIYLLKRYYKKPDDSQRSYVEDFYGGTWKNFVKLGLLSAFEKHLLSFSNPVTTVNALTEKHEAIFTRAIPLHPLQLPLCMALAGASFLPPTNSPPELSELLPHSEIPLGHKTLEEIVRDPLSIDLIDFHLSTMFKMYPYYELEAALKAPHPDVTSDPDPSGYLLLCDARYLLEIAIIQNVMMSGDSALFLLEEKWRSGNQDEVRAVEDILAINSLLAHNFALVVSSKELQQRGHSITTYAIAYSHSGDSRLLGRLLPSPWKIEWTKKNEQEELRWYMLVGSTKIPLPTPDELLQGNLHSVPDLNRLMGLKEKLSSEIALYETVNGVQSKAQERALKVSILRAVR